MTCFVWTPTEAAGCRSDGWDEPNCYEHLASQWIPWDTDRDVCSVVAGLGNAYSGRQPLHTTTCHTASTRPRASSLGQDLAQITTASIRRHAAAR